MPLAAAAVRSGSRARLVAQVTTGPILASAAASPRRGVTVTVTVVWIDAGLPPAGEIPAHPMTSDSAVPAKLTTAVGRQVKVHTPRPRRGPATS